MATWKLCFVLLLPLTLCYDVEVNLVKTLGSKPDVTPVCNNTALDLVILVVCKIRTERNREECRLLYHREKGFENECDSRFTFITKKTVFLHLTSLTPAESGTYNCECSYDGGTYILHLNITVEEFLHLNITVEEDEDTSSSTHMNLSALIGVTVFIIITGLILGFIYKTKCNRDRSATSGRETPGSLDNDDPDDPYTSLHQPAGDVYQTISSPPFNEVTDQLDDKETDGGETDLSYEVYENI